MAEKPIRRGKGKSLSSIVLGTIITRYGLTVLFMVVSIFVSWAFGGKGKTVITAADALNGSRLLCQEGSALMIAGLVPRV